MTVPAAPPPPPASPPLPPALPRSVLQTVKGWLRPLPGVQRLGRAVRYVISAEARAAFHLEWSAPANLFQPFPTTSFDRYPEIFRRVAAELAGLRTPELLSFGCSTGEELLSLHRYLPQARLTGVEISRRNLHLCRRTLEREQLQASLHLGGTLPPGPAERFDAAFCMAVFRHGVLRAEQRDSCAEVIRFAAFEATLLDIDASLRPGGLLAIANSNFRFADTRLADRYDMLLEMPVNCTATPLYGRENQRLPARPRDGVLFRKRHTAGECD